LRRLLLIGPQKASERPCAQLTGENAGRGPISRSARLPLANLNETGKTLPAVEVVLFFTAWSGAS